MSSAIFQQVVEATRGEYVLHGTLGQSDALGNAFLAREIASGRSVLLVVPPDAESLDVVGALSDTIPADAGGCAACGFRFGTWTDACPRCEHLLLPAAGVSPDVGALRDQLRETFHVVGGVPHVRGGTMYFAEDAGDGRLLAFVVRPQPDGQLALDVVWEAVADVASAPAARAVEAAGVAGEGTGGFRGADAREAGAAALVDAPAPYPATHAYEAPALERAPSQSRRWLPVGLGLGAVAAVGVAAYAFTRTPDQRPVGPRTDPVGMIAPHRVDSTLIRDPIGLRPGDPNLRGETRPDSVGSLPMRMPNDSLRVARALRRHVRDSLRAVRLQNSAILTIDGDLPTGWGWTVNGRDAGNARDVPLTIGQPVTIRIEAPGYCADTLSMTPAPRSRQHWAPTLHGRPTVGEC